MKQTYLVIDAIQNTFNYNYCFLDALAKTDIDLIYATTEFAHVTLPNPPGVKTFQCFFKLAALVNRFIKVRALRRFLRGVEYPLNLIFLFIYILLDSHKFTLSNFLVNTFILA